MRHAKARQTTRFLVPRNDTVVAGGAVVMPGEDGKDGNEYGSRGHRHLLGQESTACRAPTWIGGAVVLPLR